MEGYPKLVETMDSHADVRIFRRFTALDIQNLLYLQAELLHLEKEWRDIQSDDLSSGDTARVALHFNVAKMQDGGGTGEETFQWAKFQEIRLKLAQYNAALLDFAKLNTLHPPDPDRLRVLQDWLERPACGNAFLQGVEARAWGEHDGVHSYLALGSTREDAVTKWLCRLIPGVYHRVLGHRMKRPVSNNQSDSTVYNYNEATLIRIVHTSSIVLSSLIPTLSIFALFYAHSTALRLCLVLIFTSLFTLCLSIFTRAGRAELFAATAAFTAVEVVFVGSVIGSKS